MPKTFKPRRRMPLRRKRPIRRRMPMRRRTGTAIASFRGPTVIPDKLIVKMPYTDIQNINGTSGPTGNYYSQKTYSLTNLNDPEPQALNQVPLGYAQFSTLYNKFRVFAVSYQIALTNMSDDSGVVGALYVASQPVSGANNSINTWVNQPRARQFSIGNKSGGSSQTRLRGTITLPKHFGLTPQQYKTSKDTYGLFSGTGPSETCNLFINLANVNTGVNGGLVQASVKLIYHVELFDRTPLISTTSITESAGQGIEDDVDQTG